MAFVYMWEHNTTKHYYIGSHWGHPDDGYICSSRLIQEHIKMNPEQWHRTILETGSRESVRRVEEEILKDLVNDPLCLNQTQGSNKPVLFKDFLNNEIHQVTPGVARILDLLKK